MNKSFFIQAKISILACSFIFISCSVNLSNKKTNDKQLLSFKNDSIEYAVYELDTKLDSENNQQCNNFKEIYNKNDGFEILISIGLILFFTIYIVFAIYNI